MTNRPQHDDETAAALRVARDRFITTFGERVDAMRALIAQSTGDAADKTAALRNAAHRLAGMAGMIGFSTVTDEARHLEDLAAAADGFALDRGEATLRLDRVRASF